MSEVEALKERVRVSFGYMDQKIPFFFDNFFSLVDQRFVTDDAKAAFLQAYLDQKKPVNLERQLKLISSIRYDREQCCVSRKLLGNIPLDVAFGGVSESVKEAYKESVAPLFSGQDNPEDE